MSGEPWSQADIARHFKVDPTTVEHWRGRDDFPDPINPSAPRFLLYDSDAVKRWHRSYKRTRYQRGRRTA